MISKLKISINNIPYIPIKNNKNKNSHIIHKSTTARCIGNLGPSTQLGGHQYCCLSLKTLKVCSIKNCTLCRSRLFKI